MKSATTQSGPRPRGQRLSGIAVAVFVLVSQIAAGSATTNVVATISSTNVVDEKAAQTVASPRVVILLHHPADHVDQLGQEFPAGNGTDTFSARYQHLVADVGRFDFPYFVADGVASVRAIPDPNVPYVSALAAYTNATEKRLGQEAPASLSIQSWHDTTRSGWVQANITVSPKSSLLDPQGQALHLWLAVTEDPVHWAPPAPVSNGVADHRFTVRALRDLGPVDLAAGAIQSVSASLSLPPLPIDPSRTQGRLAVAAWLQADGVPGRFLPHEIVQAVQADVDGPRSEQLGKGVLVEVYSATWCTPCLVGDLAVEALAIQMAGAQPLKVPARSYFEAPSQPMAVLLAVVAAAGLAAFAPLRRPR